MTLVPLLPRRSVLAAPLLAPLLAGLLAFLAACSPAQNPGQDPAKAGPAAGPERIVNVYSARHYDADERLFRTFEAATGIRPRVITADGPALLQRLKEEGDQTSADVILTVDVGNLTRLAQDGLTQAVSDDSLAKAIPAAVRDPQGQWFGLTKRYRVIAYAKDRVRPEEVATMDALAQPRFRGKVCARSSTNIYNLSMMAARIERDGAPKAETWARAVASNFARQPQGGDTDQLRAIAGGVCDVAIVNHYYVVRMQNSADPADRAAGAGLAISVPDQAGAGVHVNISGASVSRYSKNKSEAIALIAFLASPQAQAEVAALNDEFPIAAGIALPAPLQALSGVKEDATPLTALGARQAEAQRVFEAAGWR